MKVVEAPISALVFILQESFFDFTYFTYLKSGGL